MRVRCSARTHVGQKREVNQDSYGSEVIAGARLLVVCDGMGGHAAGEVASTLGVETILQQYDATEREPVGALKQVFATANDRIYGDGKGNMGTTGVAALLVDDKLYVANVGDSRAYLIREGQIEQISRDHSLVSDQVDAGLLTPDQARHSNIRNIITRALGHQVQVEVDVFQRPVQAGDTVVLSSDGLHGLVDDAEIAEIAGILPPEEAVQRLVDRANALGGNDNITVVIAHVDELDAATSEPDATAPTTAELPVDAPAPVAVRQSVAPATPALPMQLKERPLSRVGLVLSLLTLVVVVAAGGFVWSRSGGAAETPPTTPVATATTPTRSQPGVAPATQATPTGEAGSRTAPPGDTNEDTGGAPNPQPDRPATPSPSPQG